MIASRICNVGSSGRIITIGYLLSSSILPLNSAHWIRRTLSRALLRDPHAILVSECFRGKHRTYRFLLFLDLVNPPILLNLLDSFAISAIPQLLDFFPFLFFNTPLPFFLLQLLLALLNVLVYELLVVADFGVTGTPTSSPKDWVILEFLNGTGIKNLKGSIKL